MIPKNPPNMPFPARADGTTEPPKRLAKTREACRYGGLGHTLLYDLINAGKVDAYKRGRQTLIDLDSIDRLHAALPKIQPRNTAVSPQAERDLRDAKKRKPAPAPALKGHARSRMVGPSDP